MTTENTPLADALRELRARTGLSFAALAQRTAYSKSSWERYLNGKSLPPRQAVQELCQLADESGGRLLALWEIAESQWRGRAAVLAPDVEEPPPLPAPTRPRARKGRKGRLMMVLASAYILLTGGVAVALLLLPGLSTPEDEPLVSSVPYSLAPQCHGAACEGRDPLRLVCGIAPDTLNTLRTATGAHVELRHSAKCGASWARVWGTRIGDRVRITAGGPSHQVRIATEDDTLTYVYTPLVAARSGSTVRACFRPAAADSEQECAEARVGGPATTTAEPSASP